MQISKAACFLTSSWQGHRTLWPWVLVTSPRQVKWSPVTAVEPLEAINTHHGGWSGYVSASQSHTEPSIPSDLGARPPWDCPLHKRPVRSRPRTQGWLPDRPDDLPDGRWQLQTQRSSSIFKQPVHFVPFIFILVFFCNHFFMLWRGSFLRHLFFKKWESLNGVMEWL